VPIADCMLASEPANAAREQIVTWCRTQGLSAYDRRSGEGFLRNLVVREGRRTNALQVRLVTSTGHLDRESLTRAGEGLDGLLWTRVDSVGETTQGGETELLAGSDRFEDVLGGMRFEISSGAFFQTNTEMAERLYQLAIEYAAPVGFERVYDLYCGIGTIGLLLSPRVAEVWGLELVPEAISDAIANARANEVDNVHFFAGDVRLALRDLTERAGRPDTLVVDPPRAGLSQKVVRRIIEAAPSRVVYVSCNPTTLAPNAAQMVEAGYELVRVRPVDMFPQTPHIECVAELVRR
jgi:23S rRNA (uracil1939-C5)-methyltransferase